jgi:serine/threonine-protein kinase RsbW
MPGTPTAMALLNPDAPPGGYPGVPAWVSERLVDVRAPLEVTGPATGSTATRERREFSAWLAVDLAAGDLFDDLVLAVYEAVANTVDHAYRHAPEPGPVLLIARRLDRAIHVTVADHGKWREAANTATPFRGRGLPLIRVLVPDVYLDLGGAGTTMHLRAHVPPPTARRPQA